MSKPVPISETESISEHLGLDEEEKEEEEIKKFKLRPLKLPPRAKVGVTKYLMIYCPKIRADMMAEFCFPCDHFMSVNFITLSIVCDHYPSTL